MTQTGKELKVRGSKIGPALITAFIIWLGTRTL